MFVTKTLTKLGRNTKRRHFSFGFTSPQLKCCLYEFMSWDTLLFSHHRMLIQNGENVMIRWEYISHVLRGKIVWLMNNPNLLQGSPFFGCNISVFAPCCTAANSPSNIVKFQKKSIPIGCHFSFSLHFVEVARWSLFHLSPIIVKH